MKAYEKEAVLDEIVDLLDNSPEDVYVHLRRLRIEDLVWLETAIKAIGTAYPGVYR